MRLLVLDQLRRLGLKYVVAALLMAALWLSLLQRGGMEPGLIFAGSVLLAWFAGPMAVLFDLPIREFGILPVSRRDVWRSRWLVTTVIAAAVTATGKSVAIAISPFISPSLPLRSDLLLVSTILDLALLGTSAAVMAWLARRRTRTAGRLGTTLDILAMLGFLGGPFVGIAGLGDHLPADLEGLKRAWWMLGPGVISFFAIQLHSPANVRLATVIAVQPAARRVTQTSARTRIRRTPASGSLAMLLIVKSAVPAVISLGVVLIGLVDQELGPRAAGDWLVVALIVGGGDWRDRLRQLRLLPISTAGLIGLILSTAILTWMIAAAMIAALHAGFPARVVSPPPALWLLPIMGVSALGEAFTLRFGLIGRMLMFVPGLFGLRFLGRFVTTKYSMSPEAGMTMLGGVTMLAAILVITYSLTRSSAPYRAPKTGLTFGAEASQTR